MYSKYVLISSAQLSLEGVTQIGLYSTIAGTARPLPCEAQLGKTTRPVRI